ncbi:unnamed protein product [Mytilus edulis]|uniref:Uncharacterized protein n=1 Tax=Mytilus edulis TaxID=6550 RepID=A0A8S3STB4_MYTED|nr:unnamed protein product [Mytilus edulis]
MDNKSFWSLLIIIFCAFQGILGQTCPQSCVRCVVDGLGDVTDVTCSDSRAFQLIPKTVQHLVFQNGSLPNGIVKDFLFLGISELESIEITNYHLKELWGAFLLNCTDLKIMDFSNNEIHSIMKSNFKGPVALEILNLEKNHINLTTDNVFENLGFLKKLHLGNNLIQTLTHNTFEGLINLQILDLSRNKISYMDGHTFQSLSKVKNINLSYNRIRNIPSGLFNGLSNLKMLQLSHNTISTISDNAFVQAGVITLDLSTNQLTKIPTEMLQQISGNKTEVLLQRNNIRMLQKNSLSNIELKLLNLASNGMDMVENDATYNCKIKYLNMRQNMLTTLPETMLIYLNSVIIPQVFLSTNPFVCDCDLIWLGKFLYQKSWKNIPKCSKPIELSRLNIVDYYNQYDTSCLTTTEEITTPFSTSTSRDLSPSSTNTQHDNTTSQPISSSQRQTTPSPTDSVNTKNNTSC